MRTVLICLTILLLSALLSADGEDGPIQFLYPRDGDTIAGKTRLQVDVRDSLGRATVNYYLDLPSAPEVPEEWELYVLGGSNFRPFRLLWDTTRVEEGRHTLTAVARLESGEEFSSTVSVFVQK